MKKTILTALTVIGMMTGAQAQQLGDNPTEFTNPFASIGAFNYVQKQSDGELNKWFLSGKNGKDKCFTIEKYERKYKTCSAYSQYRAAKIVNTEQNANIDNIQFCCVYELSDDEINNDIAIQYTIIYFGESQETSCGFSVKGYNDNNGLVKNHESNTKNTIAGYLNNEDNILLNNTTTFEKEKSKFISYTIKNENNNKYICIQLDLGKKAGEYFIESIKINNKWFFNEQLSMIQYDANGGSQIENMYCLFTNEANSSNSILHIFNKSGEEIGSGMFKPFFKDEKVQWGDGFEPIPSRDGYTFKGWQLNEEVFDFKIDNSVDEGNMRILRSPFMGDMTLVAQWEQIGEGGGTEPNPGVVTAINGEIAQTYYSNGVLRTAGTYDVNVYNASGVLVKAAHNVSELDLSELKSGLYIARVNGETIKFVK